MLGDLGAHVPAPKALDAERAQLASNLYRWMTLSRTLEDRLRALYQQGRLRGRLISGRGQEAIPVGVCLPLAEGDVVAPVHRDLGAHLVRGTTVLDVLRHYLGRASSLSGGRDGDIHMGEWRRGIFPMVSHLPDSWPVMAGVAHAFKLRRRPHVAVAFAGDGATSAGAWHEAVNFASVFELPVLFVVENNQYAYSTPRHRQYRVARLVDRAAAYGIPGVQVDGNDALAVFDATADILAAIRAGGGPRLLEAETFRIDGHAIHDDAAYVPAAVREPWLARDPLARLGERLRATGTEDTELTRVRAEAEAEVAEALKVAEAEPLPNPSTLEGGVYAEKPSHAAEPSPR